MINNPIHEPLYYIKSHKGYWKAHARGYTDNKDEAGIFTCSEMNDYSLDGVTLIRVD